MTKYENLTRWTMIEQDFELFSFDKCYEDNTPMHYHENFYEIYFFQEGCVTYHIDMNQYRLEPGDMLLIPPGVMHWPFIHDSGRPYKRMFIWINQEYLKSIGTQDSDLTKCFYFDNHGYVLRLDQDELLNISLQISQLLTLKVMHRFGDDLRRRALMTLLMLEVNRICLNPDTQRLPFKAPSQRIQTIVGFIDGNLINQDLSIEAISRAMYLSKSTIAKTFYGQTGITLHKYITKVRMNRAYQMLQRGMSANAAGQALGYKDYSSFYRAFLKEYGSSPSTVFGIESHHIQTPAAQAFENVREIENAPAKGRY